MLDKQLRQQLFLRFIFFANLYKPPEIQVVFCVSGGYLCTKTLFYKLQLLPKMIRSISHINLVKL